MRWTEYKPGRFQAERDGRKVLLRHLPDGRWHWLIEYPGVSECRRGDEANRRAAEQAIMRSL